MFCTNCGKQLQDTQNFCTDCGKQVVVYTSPQPNNQQQVPFQQQININIPPQEANNASPDKVKFRHGFATFWLWLGFIQSIFGFLVVLFLYIIYDEWLLEIIEYYYPELSSGGWLVWLMLISASTIFGLWNIIKYWKKRGFYFIIFAFVLSVILVYFYFPSAVGAAIFQCAIYPIITFFILKIKNTYNAKSTWEQLE